MKNKNTNMVTHFDVEFQHKLNIWTSRTNYYKN